jgi:hypothetical protein
MRIIFGGDREYRAHRIPDQLFVARGTILLLIIGVGVWCRLMEIASSLRFVQ